MKVEIVPTAPHWQECRTSGAFTLYQYMAMGREYRLIQAAIMEMLPPWTPLEKLMVDAMIDAAYAAQEKREFELRQINFYREQYGAAAFTPVMVAQAKEALRKDFAK